MSETDDEVSDVETDVQETTIVLNRSETLETKQSKTAHQTSNEVRDAESSQSEEDQSSLTVMM